MCAGGQECPLELLARRLCNRSPGRNGICFNAWAFAERGQRNVFAGTSACCLKRIASRRCASSFGRSVKRNPVGVLECLQRRSSQKYPKRKPWARAFSTTIKHLTDVERSSGWAERLPSIDGFALIAYRVCTVINIISTTNQNKRFTHSATAHLCLWSTSLVCITCIPLPEKKRRQNYKNKKKTNQQANANMPPSRCTLRLKHVFLRVEPKQTHPYSAPRLLGTPNTPLETRRQGGRRSST